MYDIMGILGKKIHLDEDYTYWFLEEAGMVICCSTSRMNSSHSVRLGMIGGGVKNNNIEVKSQEF